MADPLSDPRREQKQKRLAKRQIDSAVKTARGLDKGMLGVRTRYTVLVLLYTAARLLSDHPAAETQSTEPAGEARS